MLNQWKRSSQISYLHLYIFKCFIFLIELLKSMSNVIYSYSFKFYCSLFLSWLSISEAADYFFSENKNVFRNILKPKHKNTETKAFISKRKHSQILKSKCEICKQRLHSFKINLRLSQRDWSGFLILYLLGKFIIA